MRNCCCANIILQVPTFSRVSRENGVVREREKNIFAFLLKLTRESKIYSLNLYFCRRGGAIREKDVFLFLFFMFGLKMTSLLFDFIFDISQLRIFLCSI